MFFWKALKRIPPVKRAHTLAKLPAVARSLPDMPGLPEELANAMLSEAGLLTGSVVAPAWGDASSIPKP